MSDPKEVVKQGLVRRAARKKALKDNWAGKNKKKKK